MIVSVSGQQLGPAGRCQRARSMPARQSDQGATRVATSERRGAVVDPHDAPSALNPAISRERGTRRAARPPRRGAKSHDSSGCPRRTSPMPASRRAGPQSHLARTNEARQGQLDVRRSARGIGTSAPGRLARARAAVSTPVVPPPACWRVAAVATRPAQVLPGRSRCPHLVATTGTAGCWCEAPAAFTSQPHVQPAACRALDRCRCSSRCGCRTR